MFTATALATRRWFPVDPIYVADADTLRGITTSSIICFITGYFGDGAPSSSTIGWYFCDLNDHTTADDGFDVIVSATQKRWKRVPFDLLGSFVTLEMFGAKGDNVADDTAALLLAAASGRRILQPDSSSKIYRISSRVTFTNPLADFGGAQFLWTGGTNEWMFVVNAPNGLNGWCKMENFVLKCTSIDTVNRNHGLNLGGGCGLVDNFRIEGFTGVSLGLGSGVDAYTAVNFPATAECYYWGVSNYNISSTAGWNLVIQAANNANHFYNMSTFPYNGFNQAPPRNYNCIDEIVIGGTGNTFERVSLEGSPSSRMVKFLSTASGNEFKGQTYLERNAS